ncbi:peroxiredoxin-like family protein [Pelagicoccus sp. SDUM812005]|uniref:peroxiredoxin-like family protein n=1 Tax=Pelagicoccus sp. SDUM812005 TaxID=3041257 RepID=UPI00280DF45C|nr:peroxiredoxin-like family protein [Pelagicoccus sp. SDUM812005]MDQ8183621.1 peroxiredoxin-like family protein [Pelagicoccus sp. SDUM812005]
MPKFVAPTPLPSFQVESIDGTTVQVPSPRHRFTHLQFRRFAGCPICDIHLQQFAARADTLEENGIQEVVFFHSSQAALLKHNAKLPFSVVADPHKVHYRAFGVEASLLSVLHPQAIWQGLRGTLRKGLGLSLKNGPLGLPADFLVGSTGTIVAAKYGTHAFDQWSLDQVLQLVQQENEPSFE